MCKEGKVGSLAERKKREEKCKVNLKGRREVCKEGKVSKSEEQKGNEGETEG